MGSILVGSAGDIVRARRIRKLMGGALRQAGIVAAAAVYAVENHVDRMADDHANARAFAEAIADIDGINIDLSAVQSNMVFFHVDPDIGDAGQMSAALREKGVRIGAMGPHRMRACTHLDVTHEQVIQASDAVRECVQEGISQYATLPYGPFARA